MAEWEGDRLTVWTGTQRPFGVRDELAGAFGLPEDGVRVIVPDTGSGYGGKHTGEAAIEAARLARAAGKPVKLVWTRAEEFTWAYFRPAGLIEARAGVGEGRDADRLGVPQLQLRRLGDRAALRDRRPPRRRSGRPDRRCGRGRTGPSPRRRTTSPASRSSTTSPHAIGMDPLAFRLKNLRDDRLLAVLKAAADRFGWGDAPTAEGRGVGLACGTEKGGYVATCAEVAVDRGVEAPSASSAP